MNQGLWIIFTVQLGAIISTHLSYNSFHIACFPTVSNFGRLYCYTNTDTKYKNTNNFILHRIKNNKTLAKSYLSMVNMYNIIQLFTIKINLKHYICTRGML